MLYKNIISFYVIILRRNYFFICVIHIISFPFSWKHEMKIHLFVEAITNIWIEYLNIISHVSIPNTSNAHVPCGWDNYSIFVIRHRSRTQNHSFSKISRRDLIKTRKDFENGRNKGKRDGGCERSLRRRKGSREICRRWQAWNSYGSFHFRRGRNP